MTMSNITSRLRSFARDEDGFHAFEALISVPLILSTIIGLFSVTDAYRSIHQNVVSTYAIGDILSREPDEVSPDFLDGLNELHTLMTRAQTDTSLRITVLHYNYVRNRYEVEWSYAKGGDKVKRTTATLTDALGKIPTLSEGESVTLVETWMVFHPISNFMIGSYEFYDAAVTRPRYSSTLAWTGAMEDSQQHSNDDDEDDYDPWGQPRCSWWGCW
ncbi:TadE/TadG family type IV pilus assembly protein [Anianabacter salinae]|uniref:TadE/TadG family type IV pilus assembly protein n=1 Tax=Anianabacter salinae TaxID=2851023 RepID=UPI00225E6FCF|nr:hypothetical protein [Anianabacter salinae]MBV0912803.1 hypothetical protein [Anianabacter salinae]